jgi:DNA-directed RNA polymerase specialized sigma24 family protein
MSRFSTRRPSSDGPPNLFDLAEHAFQLLCQGPGALAIDGERVGHGLPARLIPLTELRCLLRHPAVPHAARDAAWRELIRLARKHGDVWVTGCLGVALPGLRRLAAGLSRGSGDATDVAAEVVVGFTHAIEHIEAATPRVTLRLHRATRMACARARCRSAVPTPLPPAVLDSAAPPRSGGHPDLLLAGAVAQGIITRLDAQLIGTTRLENVSLRRIAKHLRMPYDVLRKRRAAAEARLREAILSGRVTSESA